jgi:hypothetical protein
MNVSDLPQEVLARIREEFEANPTVQDMRMQQQMCVMQGRLSDALGLAKKLELLYNRCVAQYMRETEDELERIDLKDVGLSDTDMENVMRLVLVCFMCADIIETSVLDMNDILHRYDKKMNIELFNDIRQLMAMSKAKLKYLQKNGDYMKGLVWADKCDDMYEMMKSKAKAIMKKSKSETN